MTDQTKRHVSRLLPGLTTEYTIVSMPDWAWYWLDTMVAQYFPEGYAEFIRECAGPSDTQRPLAEILEGYARLFREDVYRLSNDNRLEEGTLPRPAAVARRPYHFPQALKLFAFLPFATTWDNVLSRRGLGGFHTTSY